jgi:hypothetical protein
MIRSQAESNPTRAMETIHPKRHRRMRQGHKSKNRKHRNDENKFCVSSLPLAPLVAHFPERKTKRHAVARVKDDDVRVIIL